MRRVLHFARLCPHHYCSLKLYPNRIPTHPLHTVPQTCLSRCVPARSGACPVTAPTASSVSPRGHTPAEGFAQGLRRSFILAAERDVFRLVTPALARGLSHAFRQASPSNQQRCCSDKHGQGQERDSKRHLHGSDSGLLEHLREQVPRATTVVGQGEAPCADVDEVLWSPVLAVFRGVDAVLSGGGRPRVSFVRRRAL